MNGLHEERAIRVVVLSACEAGDRFIIQRLHETGSRPRVIRPVGASAPERRQLLRHTARTPGRSVQALYRRRQRRTFERKVTWLLFGSAKKPSLAHERIETGALNGLEGVKLLKSMAPDLLLLLGCPILGEDVLSVPRLGTVNLHFGIAPAYRGEHTLFFALQRRDFDNVGVTLHVVPPGPVDSGPILSQAFPALEPTDDEATVWAKCAQQGADLVADLVSALEIGCALSGEVQGEAGTLYRRRDRSAWHDVQYWLDRKVLGYRPVPRDARRVRHHAASIDDVPRSGGCWG